MSAGTHHTKKAKDKLISVSWSASQQAVHVEMVAECCEANLEAFKLNQPIDYVPLAVFHSRKAASKFARQVQKIRNLRHGGAASWN
jgi:hypothetical protein